MTLFGESHEALEAIIDDEEERKLMYEDFEVILRENNGVLRMISEKIKSQEQEQELDLKSSTTSGSTKTSKISSRSSRKSSRTPPSNSSLSVREKRVQLGDIASLRATMALAEERQRKELEYRRKMDEVQRKKMEIKREEEHAKEELKALEENFRIKQELVQKEAQMIASIKHEDNHILLDEFSNRPPMEIGSRSLLEKFLDDQSASETNHLFFQLTAHQCVNLREGLSHHRQRATLH